MNFNINILPLMLMVTICSAQIKMPVKNVPNKSGHKQLSSAITQYPLKFDGFEFELHSDSQDEAGNHVLTGSITAIPLESKNRPDQLIVKALEKSAGSTFDLDVIVTTDSKFIPSYVELSSGHGVAKYNGTLHKFVIASDSFIGEMINGQLVTYYRPIIRVVDEKLAGQTYRIFSSNSCKVLDFFVQDRQIHIFTTSNRISNAAKNGRRIEILTVDTRTLQPSDPALSMLNPTTLETKYDENVSLEISHISQAGDIFYFLTSSIAQTEDMHYINRLYKFNDSSIEELSNENPALASDKSHWQFTSGFNGQLNEGFFFSISKSIGYDVTLIKTDRDFQTLYSTTIGTKSFTDDDRAVELNSGTVLLASSGIGNFWVYTVYDKQLQKVREIASNIPENFSLNLFTVGESGIVRAIFNKFGKSDKDSVIIQDIDLSVK